jgi:hypothetical protein
MKRSVAKLPLVGLIRSVLVCFISLNTSCIFFIHRIIQNILLTYYGLFCDSKCLGCIYVQRESKTSDFKGVSGA